jgi:hypothetical protein
MFYNYKYYIIKNQIVLTVTKQNKEPPNKVIRIYEFNRDFVILINVSYNKDIVK